MSYEKKMLDDFKMPAREKVEDAIIIALFKHNGVIKEFASGQEIVNEIADEFKLNEKQRTVYLETIYRKENRQKKSLLWHRLLFRAADNLANKNLVSRPTQTMKLTNKREWMLTERGFNKVLGLLNIPSVRKDVLSTKSYEVQKIVKKLKEAPRPDNYNPFDNKKKVTKITKETSLRRRGFRQAVIEAYDYRCAVCGLRICSPDFSLWEVEAAHIVPHHAMGKDDIWNGLALCHLHHWAFDVGWFTLLDNYNIKVSSRIHLLSRDFGRMGEFEFIKSFTTKRSRILLPNNDVIYPHLNSIKWHQENVFYE